ncbi:MAG TPA: glycerate kinase [Desulfobaccales bacterium]|nr:glycerate kinase [Desulfobaccales bacterium]
MDDKPQRLLKAIFRAALRAADPEALIQARVHRRGNHLVVADRTYALADFRRVFLIGAGKAAALMARALQALLEDRLTAGLVIVKYGHAVSLRRTRVIEAGHPIPDQSGLAATAEMLHLLGGCGADDLVIGVFSGGASALLPAPVPPLDLPQKQSVTQLLLECGADIAEINCLRKHLSRSKGGSLARAAYPATLVSLILSDVVGDRLDVIASGPTVPDASRFADCLAIVARYNLASRLPEVVWQYLQDGAVGLHQDTPKAGDPIFAKVQNAIVGNNRIALLAAREQAENLGFKTLLLSSCLEGEAREVGRVLAAVGKEILLSGHPLRPPACVLAGGETTVTLRGPGQGGRNQELALASAIALDGLNRLSLLAAGTDGTDGPTDAAGAVVDGATCARARAAGLDPGDFLARQDSYNFFAALGNLLITGPTRTNVMDIICLLIE